MNSRVFRICLGVFAAIELLRSSATAQVGSAPAVWNYRLLEGSYLVDECQICGRPTIQEPLRGSFNLVLTENLPPFTRYELRDISFIAGAPTSGVYTVTGSGTLQIGGEKTNQQFMTLELEVTPPGAATLHKVFTNDLAGVDRTWPVIDIHLVQTDYNLLDFYSLHVLAAPLREIWFSTAASFTASKWSSPTNRVSDGDVISDSGRVVRSSGDLLRRLGIMPGIPDLGIDAMDVAPGGEVLFSLKEDVFSETLGLLRHGDLLSERGTLVRRNQDLMAAFNPQPVDLDYGLDAVQVLDGGEIYFSITTNVVSPQIGMLFRGDVLSDKGSLVRSHQQLLARFHPSVVDHDYGLDALYVWPSGEMWFSTEEGFADSLLGPIRAGDLLSTQGFIVFRNLELTSAFAPVEDLADFGFDALYLITDASPAAPPPRMVSLHRVAPYPGIALQWLGPGRVFQIERATDLSGSFLPLSPLLPDLNWTDMSGAPTNGPSFYRVRQW